MEAVRRKVLSDNAVINEHQDRAEPLLGLKPDSDRHKCPGIRPVPAGVLIYDMGEERSHFPLPPVVIVETGLAPVTAR
ncbi:hypothetical protein MDUV_29950 [Mycolicibacterium duvalii]|uniref:Uncharacterized protein n=1 Tax=Mycolicibacterium duvalii TaxID=39688 RepID=A0A7I7K255_9MYCO|nr:hypothetical protein MDUV_29950 [Mycolicibacterium duvalii]